MATDKISPVYSEDNYELAPARGRRICWHGEFAGTVVIGKREFYAVDNVRSAFFHMWPAKAERVLFNKTKDFDDAVKRGLVEGDTISFYATVDERWYGYALIRPRDVWYTSHGENHGVKGT